MEAVEDNTVEAVENEDKVSVEIKRDDYVEGRTASGTKSLNNGDKVASKLNALSMEDVHAVTLACTEIDTTEKYAHLNVGMQRMNCGNRLRGWLADEEKSIFRWEQFVSELESLIEEEAEEEAEVA